MKINTNSEIENITKRTLISNKIWYINQITSFLSMSYYSLVRIKNNIPESLYEKYLFKM